MISAPYPHPASATETSPPATLKDLLAQAAPKIEQVRGKELVFVVGNTDAGKSTLITCLQGRTLMQKRVGGRRVLDLAQDDTDIAIHSPQIGHTLASETQFPEIHQLVEPIAGHTWFYCDTPGFKDNRRAEQRTCATIATQMAIYNASSIRNVIAVIDNRDLSVTRGESFKELMKLLSQFIYEYAKRDMNVLFVFTKIADMETTRDELLQQIREHREHALQNCNSLMHRIRDYSQGYVDIAVNYVKSTGRKLYGMIRRQHQEAIAQQNVPEELVRLAEELDEWEQALRLLDIILQKPDNIFLMYDQPNQSLLRRQIIERLLFLPQNSILKSFFNFSVFDEETRKFEQTLLDMMKEYSDDMRLYLDAHEKLKQTRIDAAGASSDIQRIQGEIDHIDQVGDPLQVLHRELAQAKQNKGILKQKIQAKQNMATQHNDNLLMLARDQSLQDYQRFEVPINYDPGAAWWSWVKFWGRSQEMSYLGRPYDGLRYENNGDGQFTQISGVLNPDNTVACTMKYTWKANAAAIVNVYAQLKKCNFPANIALINEYKQLRDGINVEIGQLNIQLQRIDGEIQRADYNIRVSTNEVTQRNIAKQQLNLSLTASQKIMQESAQSITRLEHKMVTLAANLHQKMPQVQLLIKIFGLMRFQNDFCIRAEVFQEQYLQYSMLVDVQQSIQPAEILRVEELAMLEEQQQDGFMDVEQVAVPVAPYVPGAELNPV